MHKPQTAAEQNILKYLLSKGGVSFLFRILGMCFSFLIIWLLSNLYDVASYGNFSIIQTILQIITLVSTLGIQNVLIFEINKHLEEKSDISLSILLKVMKILLAFSIIPVCIMFFGAGFISTEIFHKANLEPHFKIIAIATLFFVLHEIFLYYFIAKKKFLVFGFFTFFFPNFIFALFIVLFHETYRSATDITLFYCLSFAVTFVFEFIVLFHKIPKIQKVLSFRRILVTSIPMMFSGLMVYLLNWTDILMLSTMKTEEEVGIYNASFKLGFLALIVIASVNVIIGPRLSEMYHNNDMANFKKMVNRSTQLSVLATIPIIVILLCFGQELLGFLGSDFKDGKLVLILITLSSFFSVASGNVDQILNMSNNQNFLMRVNLFCLLMNVVLNFILIPQNGIIGAAIASMTTTILMNMICVFYIKKKFGFYTFI